MRRHMRRLVPLGILAAVAAFAGAMLGGTGMGVAANQVRPTNQAPPTITGTPQVGSTLTAREGTWSGSPTDFDYAWRRCDADGGSCSLISGAEEKTYVLKEVDQGNTLRVRVTAQNTDGRTTATSVPTAVIREAATPPPPPSTTGCDRPGTGVPPEAPTGADGFAELRVNRLRGFPASQRQQLLVAFVRARKQGEPLLGGISTRRLVSFPVNLSC